MSSKHAAAKASSEDDSDEDKKPAAISKVSAQFAVMDIGKVTRQHYLDHCVGTDAALNVIIPEDVKKEEPKRFKGKVHAVMISQHTVGICPFCQPINGKLPAKAFQLLWNGGMTRHVDYHHAHLKDYQAYKKSFRPKDILKFAKSDNNQVRYLCLLFPPLLTFIVNNERSQ